MDANRWRIGLAQLERARDNGLNVLVLADSAHGDVTEFRSCPGREVVALRSRRRRRVLTL